jgi:hypothetical protein
VDYLLTEDRLVCEIIGDGTYPIIKNPYLSDRELLGLYNTFAIYVLAPRAVYPLVRIAEEDNEFSVRLRKHLVDIYCNQPSLPEREEPAP